MSRPSSSNPRVAGSTPARRTTDFPASDAAFRSRWWQFAERSHVDFAAGWLRLDPGETKNDEGRQFPLISELRTLLEAQRARGEGIQKKTKRIVPWIFARDDGAPVGDFKKAWATACIKAGFLEVVPVGEPKPGEPVRTRKMPTRLFHDFRRTAVRNLERSSVSRSTAMKLTGHWTESVYRRYAIVAESDLREAGAKLTAAAAEQGGKVPALSSKIRAISAEGARRSRAGPHSASEPCPHEHHSRRNRSLPCCSRRRQARCRRHPDRPTDPPVPEPLEPRAPPERPAPQHRRATSRRRRMPILWIYLRRRANKKGVCWPKQAAIARETSRPESARSAERHA